jgi:hypothetical protein
MKKLSAVVFIGLVAAISGVRGDIIPSFTGATPSSGNTVWAYQIDITSDQQVTSGDFFTIYDFGPFISGSNVQPADWTFSFSLVGTTPAGTLPPDDPSLFNLTWTYTGSATIPTGSTLGPFSVSTPGFDRLARTHNSYFAAQATRGTGPSAGTKINNVGQIPVPVSVPEPSTLSMIVIAGLAIAAYRRRK